MGFSLIELAIVLVIVTLLTGGAITALRVQAQRSAFSDTQAALLEARDALLGYAINHGRLPCPATDATGTSHATCPGNARRGLVPWSTLGIRAEDAWNQRLSYEVSTTLTTAPLSDPSPGNSVSLREARGGSSVADDGSLAFAIWSHGTNGHEALNAQGVWQDASPDNDEHSNAPRTPPTPLQVIVRPHSDTYDDQVSWVSKYILYRHLLDAGLPLPSASSP